MSNPLNDSKELHPTIFETPLTVTLKIVPRHLLFYRLLHQRINTQPVITSSNCVDVR